MQHIVSRLRMLLPVFLFAVMAASAAQAADPSAVSPAIVSVSVPTNGSYNAGKNLDFTLNVSEPVVVNTDGGTPWLALNVGGAAVFADYLSGSGTTALVLRHVVQAGENDNDGIGLPVGISPNGGTLRDAAGNDLSLALNGVDSTAGVIVDTIAPVATGMVRLDPNPTTSASVRYEIEFSEPVTGLYYGSFGAWTLGVGMGGSVVWVSTITQISPTSYELLVVGLKGTGKMHIFLLPYAKVYDLAGNRITAGITSPDYDVNRVPPLVTSVAVPAEATYRAGENLDFTVSFDNILNISTSGGIPRIPITLDTGGTAYAYYLRGRSTNTLVFRMTVVSGQADATGVKVGTMIDLVGGTIRDTGGYDVNPTLNSVASTTGVRVDAVPPVVVGDGIPKQFLTIGAPASVLGLLPFFTDEGSTSLSYSVTGNSNSTMATADITGSNLTLTPLATGITNVTVLADDNHGGTVSDSFEVAVGTRYPTPAQTTISGTLNTQTGLFDLTVNVTNTTAFPINGFRLHVNYSTYLAAYPSLRLYNASSPAGSGDVYVDYPYPMPVDATVSLKLSFYTSTRTFPSPFTPVLAVETLASSQLPDTNGAGVQPRMVKLPDQTVLIEFPSVPGHWYRVRYSPDMTHWLDCPVPLQASGTRVQWIDSGPPFTSVPPSQAPSRFYIVNEITTP